MDHKPFNNNKVEYYKDLFSRKDKESKLIYEAIAEKLLGTLEMNVLDFGNNPKKEVYINRVRYINNILLFRIPLRLNIEKFDGGFSIYQREFSILVFSESFKDTLIKFQEIFFTKYRTYSKMKGKNDEEKYFIELFKSLVKKEI